MVGEISAELEIENKYNQVDDYIEKSRIKPINIIPRNEKPVWFCLAHYILLPGLFKSKMQVYLAKAGHNASLNHNRQRGKKMRKIMKIFLHLRKTNRTLDSAFDISEWSVG